VEGRRRQVMGPLEGNMSDAQKSGSVSTKQQRLAELARRDPGVSFTSLNHHLDLLWMVEAYNRTRKDGAPGVDGQTASDYGLTLLDNQRQQLLNRAKSGRYFAPPVRRVHIPKGTGSGETRPLGNRKRWRTKSCSGRSSWRWSRSTSRTSGRARTVSGRGGRRTRRCRPYGTRSCSSEAAGCWTWTSGSSLTLWITITFGRCCVSGCATGCCCA